MAAPTRVKAVTLPRVLLPQPPQPAARHLPPSRPHPDPHLVKVATAAVVLGDPHCVCHVQHGVPPPVGHEERPSPGPADEAASFDDGLGDVGGEEDPTLDAARRGTSGGVDASSPPPGSAGPRRSTMARSSPGLPVLVERGIKDVEGRVVPDVAQVLQELEGASSGLCTRRRPRRT